MTERTDEQIGRASLETKTPTWHGDGTDGGVSLDSGTAGIEPWQVNAPIWRGDAQEAEAAPDTSWLRAAQERCEAAPPLCPYATAKGGVVILNGPFDLQKAAAAVELIDNIADLPRALELLRQTAEALEAAIAGIKFACEYYAPSSSAQAQILAHINGYDGGPDARAILDRIRKGDSE